MTMTPEIAQLRIVRELREAEAALDNALLKQSILLSTMVEARQATQSGPFVGQEALIRLSKSQHTLVTAANDMARVHANLLQVQHEVLGWEDCPDEARPMGVSSSEDAGLRESA